MCLLHIMCGLARKLSYELVAVHVHHGLREEADSDEAFCRSLCQNLGIELVTARVDVPKRVQQTGESVEEAARILDEIILEKGI